MDGTGTRALPAAFLESSLPAAAAVWPEPVTALNSPVRAWGYNYSGELGNNSTTDSHIAVAVSSSD